MNYPEHVLKGIPNPDYFYEDGVLKPDLFGFSVLSEKHGDVYEDSINWEDHNDVIPFTLNQKNKRKNDEYQFKAGIAVISKFDLDIMRNKGYPKGYLDYERAPLEDNPYHGNLLVPKNIDKHRKRTISVELCMNVKYIVGRNGDKQDYPVSN